MNYKYIIYGLNNGVPVGLATNKLFDSYKDAQNEIDQETEYGFDPRLKDLELKINKFHLHKCNDCGKDLLPEDRTYTVHLGVVNYRGITLIVDDFDKIYCQECGDKLQVVVPKQIGSPVRMLQGEVYLHCKAMPCYTPNNLHGCCMMGGCDKIHETIVRFGPIVGIQIVTEAVRRYDLGYDMEYLLEDVINDIVGTI